MREYKVKKSIVNFPNIVFSVSIISIILSVIIVGKNDGALQGFSYGAASCATLGIMVLFIGAAFYKKIRLKTVLPILILTIFCAVIFILSKAGILPASSSSAMGLLFGGLYILMMLISSPKQLKNYFSPNIEGKDADEK